MGTEKESREALERALAKEAKEEAEKKDRSDKLVWDEDDIVWVG